ncbi:MAG: hypothetical protein JNK15_13585 [Planctomycetes bacterium]|nr:hypothetical protein [Planctomycetota bacterium]
MRVPLVAAALTATALTALPAQGCLRPVPPPGGHATAVDLLVPVVYGDGYQTFGSMILPTTPAPSCGWPLVVFVHPFGNSRGFDLSLQLELGAAGFAVWSYDVRAHGQAQAVNVGHAHEGTTMWGPIERYDLAEQIQFVGAQPQWNGIVDATRVAIVGNSQGGGHAWQAAAWSGQPIAAPGRVGTVFPPIACSVAIDLVADHVDDWLRGGTMFSSWFVEAIAGGFTGVPFAPGFVQTCRNAFVAQDPAVLVAAFAAEQRGVGSLLATSPVPVLHSHAYHDNVCDPSSAVVRSEARAGLQRELLGTLGHGVPTNTHEVAARTAAVVRWCNRFLWAVPNEVDLEARSVLAELPLAAAERLDPGHLWSHAVAGALAPAQNATRLFLHDDATMQVVAPTTPQTDAMIQQTVDPFATDFTALDYLTQPPLRTLPAVLARCPLQQRTWTFVVGAESQLVRSAGLHLRVVPWSPRWMLAALLTVEAPGTGEEVMLGGAATVGQASTPGFAEDRVLRLPPVAARLPAGTVVRLRLRNLWQREAPMTPSLEVAPLFHDFRVDVVHADSPAGSWLDLPLEPVAPRLAVAPAILDLAAPVPLAATVRGGTSRGGYPYFGLVGLSGQGPGVPYLNDVIPVDGDWLAITSAASNTSMFAGFLGFLDGAGTATMTFDLVPVGTIPAVLNGLSFTFAAFVWDGPWAPTGAASAPGDVWLR